MAVSGQDHPDGAAGLWRTPWWRAVNYEFSILAWLGWKTTVETVVLLNNLADTDKICPTFSVNEAVNTVNVTIALITCPPLIVGYG